MPVLQRRRSGLTVALLLLLFPAVCRANAPQFWNRFNHPRRNVGIDLNPFDDDEDETIAAKIVPGASALATMFYGSLLLVFPHDCRGQVYFLTMMRSTGFNKIEKGIKAIRKNVRQAVFSAIWHAPSFVMAARSITHMKARINQQRAIMAVAKRAREDGIISKDEAKRIKRLRKNQIRTLQTDMKRMVRAGGSLGTVIKVLDIDEVLDLIKGFLFQLTTVLATGHGDTALGIFIARYCLTLNMGTLLLDMQRKMNFPLTAFILRAKNDAGEIKKKKIGLVNNVGKSLVFGVSGYLSFFQPKSARILNSALLGAAICLRGIRAFANTLWDKKDANESTAKMLSMVLNGALAGVVMATLTGYGVLLGKINREGGSLPPAWLNKPIDAVEAAIKKLSDVFHKAD